MGFGDQFAKKLAKAVENRTDAKARELFLRIKANTPVDTGAARDAWELRFEGDGFSRRAVISNPLPYVAELEHGSSSQAPVGIIGPSIREVSDK